MLASMEKQSIVVESNLAERQRKIQQTIIDIHSYYLNDDTTPYKSNPNVVRVVSEIFSYYQNCK